MPVEKMQNILFRAQEKGQMIHYHVPFKCQLTGENIAGPRIEGPVRLATTRRVASLGQLVERLMKIPAACEAFLAAEKRALKEGK